MEVLKPTVETLKGVSEALTKHKRKFVVALTAMGLMFVLALKELIPGEAASTDIKVVALGFILLEVVGRTKLLSNGK